MGSLSRTSAPNPPCALTGAAAKGYACCCCCGAASAAVGVLVKQTARSRPAPGGCLACRRAAHIHARPGLQQVQQGSHESASSSRGKGEEACI